MGTKHSIASCLTPSQDCYRNAKQDNSFVLLIFQPDIHQKCQSSRADYQSTEAKKSSRQQASTENCYSGWKDIAESKKMHTTSDACFVPDDQLKSQNRNQHNVMQELLDHDKLDKSSQKDLLKKSKELMAKTYKKTNDNEKRADNDDCEKDAVAHKRSESFKLQKKIRKFMAKEYEDDNKREQPASIYTCTNERDFTRKSNVSDTVHETDFERKRGELMPKKDPDVITVEPPEDKEDETVHEKFNKAASGLENKKQDKKKHVKKKRRSYLPTNSPTSIPEKIKFRKALVFLVSLGLLPQVNLEPIKQTILTYDLLITSLCDRTNFNRSQPCQLSGYQLADTIQHCGFQAMCKPGYKAKCVNTLQGGMAHICSPENLTCHEGIRRKAWIDKDNPDLVRVQEEKCPNGTFQPCKSNCFDACTEKHLDTNAIPEKYTLYSRGDNISPTYVYCNYKKGFFNREHKTLLDYDQESQHNHYFCWHVDDIDQVCIETKYPLPNGTCVPECMPGECRDDHDDFICKRNCGNEASENNENDINGHQNEDVDECHRNKDICKNGFCQNTPGSYICECPEGFTLDRKTDECIEKGKTQDKPSDKKDTTIIVVSIILPVCFVIGVAVIIIHVVLKRRWGSNVPAADGPSLTSSEGVEESTMSASSVSADSEDRNSANGNLYPFNKTESNTSHVVKFNNGVSTVNINYNNYVTESANQHSRKDNCKVDLNTSEENLDLRKEDGRNKHSDTNRVNKQAMEVPKTRSPEVKDSELACQDDTTTPLLRKEPDLDCVTVSPDQRQKPFGIYPDRTDVNVLHKNDRKGFEGEGLKKNVDDTFTQSLMTSLKNNMESCGALIYKGDLAGTVFRVGSKYVMTAFHVIQCILINQSRGSDFDFTQIDNCPDVFVNFMESVCDRARQLYRVKVTFVNEDIDVAILELVDFTGDAPPSLLLWPYDATMLGHNSVSVAGYGHEKSPYKKHLEKCQVLTYQQVEDRFKAAHAWLGENRQEFISDIRRNGKDHISVDRGYAGYDNENIIKFDCFMGKGLSGGPVLTNEANSVKVIGMVIGGKPEFYYNLSPQKQVSFPNEYRFEFGVKMHFVFTIIRSENPALARDIFRVEA